MKKPTASIYRCRTAKWWGQLGKKILVFQHSSNGKYNLSKFDTNFGTAFVAFFMPKSVLVTDGSFNLHSPPLKNLHSVPRGWPATHGIHRGNYLNIPWKKSGREWNRHVNTCIRSNMCVGISLCILSTAITYKWPTFKITHTCMCAHMRMAYG